MPVHVSYIIDENFGEDMLDMLQDAIERSALDAWQMSVSGNNMLGVGVNDSRYQKELESPDVITRENTPYKRVSIFQGGMMAEAYEKGVPPYDLKKGLLSGKNAKIANTKHGPVRYNTVPFRHGTGSDQGKGHFPKMPKGLKKIVSKPFDDKKDKFDNPRYQVKAGPLGFSTKEKSGFRAHRTHDLHFHGELLPAQQGHRVTGLKNYDRKLKVIKPRTGVNVTGWKNKTYKWQTGRYQGMIKQEEEYDFRIQSTFMTFRRVSDNSDPNSWWHPGFPKKPILQSLAHYVENEIPNILKGINRNRQQGVI